MRSLTLHQAWGSQQSIFMRISVSFAALPHVRVGRAKMKNWKAFMMHPATVIFFLCIFVKVSSRSIEHNWAVASECFQYFLYSITQGSQLNYSRIWRLWGTVVFYQRSSWTREMAWICWRDLHIMFFIRRWSVSSVLRLVFRSHMIRVVIWDDQF